MKFKAYRIGRLKIDWIYISLIGMICTDPLLFRFISSTTTLRSIELLFFIVAIWNFVVLWCNNKLVSYSGFPKVLVVGLVIILVGILLRGNYNVADPKQFMIHILGASINCILPMLILFLPNHKYQDRILRIFFYGSLIYLPIVFFNVGTGLVQVMSEKPWTGESIGVWLPFFAAFLLGLMNKNFNRIERFAIIGIWLMYFILMLLNARRNVSFSLAVYVIIAYFYVAFKNAVGARNVIAITVSAFVLVLFVLFFDQLAFGPFRAMYERATADTRSGVEKLLLADFANAPISDWIFGRGLDGGYYQEMWNSETEEIVSDRQGIETGYLNMLLKGGIVFDVVVVLLIFCSIVKAFKKNDKDSYYLGWILITYLIDNYTTNPIYLFGSRSIIFWFMISSLLANKKKIMVRY